jgi:hypothetical protein
VAIVLNTGRHPSIQEARIGTTAHAHDTAAHTERWWLKRGESCRGSGWVVRCGAGQFSCAQSES